LAEYLKVICKFTKNVFEMRISGLALLLALFTLGFSNASKAQFVEERSIDTLNMAEREDQQMVIKVYDAATKKPVPSDVIVKGINARKPLVFKAVEDTSVRLHVLRP
jgi:hypothetical protein